MEHTIQVCRLYRRALKSCVDWYHNPIYMRKAMVAIRAQFEKNRQLKDPEQLDFLLAVTESILNCSRHPEPYVPPKAVGGTMYERNTVLPKEVSPLPYGTKGISLILSLPHPFSRLILHVCIGSRPWILQVSRYGSLR